MGAVNTRLPLWLAHETTTSGRLQDEDDREITYDSLGMTASEDRQSMRLDVMVVGLTTENLCGKESRLMKARKANRGETSL